MAGVVGGRPALRLRHGSTALVGCDALGGGPGASWSCLAGVLVSCSSAPPLRLSSLGARLSRLCGCLLAFEAKSKSPAAFQPNVAATQGRRDEEGTTRGSSRIFACSTSIGHSSS